MLAGKGPEMGLGALICGRCRLDLLRRVKARPTSMVTCRQRKEAAEETEEDKADGGRWVSLGMTGTGIAHGHVTAC